MVLPSFGGIFRADDVAGNGFGIENGVNEVVDRHVARRAQIPFQHGAEGAIGIGKDHHFVFAFAVSDADGIL